MAALAGHPFGLTLSLRDCQGKGSGHCPSVLGSALGPADTERPHSVHAMPRCDGVFHGGQRGLCGLDPAGATPHPDCAVALLLGAVIAGCTYQGTLGPCLCPSPTLSGHAAQVVVQRLKATAMAGPVESSAITEGRLT